MTLFNCSKHGLKGNEHVCKHAYEAFENGAAIRYLSIPDEFLGAIWLCSDCVALYNNLKEFDRIEDIYDSLEACCNQCFKELQEQLRS